MQNEQNEESGKGQRLNHKQIATVRADLLVEQHNKCAVCGTDISADPMQSPVLDHNHKTGFIRGTLHRGCNALLGKIENTLRMNGLDDDSVHLFLIGASNYLIKHKDQQTDMLHPTYKTAEEKKAAKLRRKKK